MKHANCPRCGGRLARDNDSGRCTPCRAAERDRLITPPTLPAAFWEHEPIRQALTERHLGQVIRAYRCHPYHGRHPLPQETVARWLGITQAQLSRVENGPAIVHLDRLTHWAQLLRIPAHHLWFKLPEDRKRLAQQRNGLGYKQDQSAEKQPVDSTAVVRLDKTHVSAATVRAETDDGGDTTNRRRFTTLAALAGIGAVGPVREAFASTELPRNIDMEHVRLASLLVDKFRQADAVVGADALCDLAIHVHTRLSSWATHSSVSREVGEALQIALADLSNQIGWLAIDAERRDEARRYLHEAITRARIADDPHEEVRALACLSLLTREVQPRESVQCAEAAQRTSAGWSTPRLNTLLHLRAAHAYANLKDAGGFSRELSKAQREFDRGTHEDDQPFLRFVTSQEMSGIQGLAYLALDRPDRAADSFRSIAVMPTNSHRRNQIYYTVRLAEAAIQQGDVNEAARTALAVLPGVTSMNSKRTSRLLVGLRSDLGRRQDATAVQEFVEAYEQAAV